MATPDIAFSAASPTIVDKMLRQMSIHEAGGMDLPPLAELTPSADALQPYSWPAGRSESQASTQLLGLLESWVKFNCSSVIPNVFTDVQGYARHAPMEFVSAGVGNFRGVPDMVILHKGLTKDDTIAPLSNCVMAVDWKKPSSFRDASNKPQGVLQAVGFSQLVDSEVGPPVFFTDMATGFRCWQMIGGELYFYRGADGTSTLSLAEGVALIRYFLIDAAQHRQAGHVRRAQLIFNSSMPPAATTAAGIGDLSSASGTAQYTPLSSKLKSSEQGPTAAVDSDSDPICNKSNDTSPEDDVAALLTITQSLAAHWSRMGGIRLASFFDQ